MKLSFLLSFALIPIVLGGKAPKRYSDFDIASSACVSYIKTVAAPCASAGKKGPKPACICKKDAAFSTFASCYVQGFDHSIIAAFIEYCNEAGVSMTNETFWERYNKLLPEQKDVKTIEGFNKTEVIDFPVKLSTKKILHFKESAQMYMKNYNLSMFYGMGLIGFWALMLLITGIVNWSIRLGFGKKFSGKGSNLYRKYISLSAAVHKKKVLEQKLGFFDCLVPSRMETIIMVLFLLLTIACCGAQLKVIPNSTQFKSDSGQLARYIADRTGIVVGYIVPLLILFGGRNNFLQYVTRLNFATFITYHRWISRIVILLVIVHAITFSISDKVAGKYKTRMKKPFMIWGTVAGISGGFILFQGMMFFRRRSYETFLLIHISLAVLFIVGAWYHTEPVGYVDFYWAAIGIWAFDRTVRIGRLISFGVPKAQITLLADETLRVVIPKPKYWHPVPGGHAFIHFLRPSCFWQSHPFTFTDSPTEPNSIVLYAKVKGGITHGIYKKLLACPGRTQKIRVCVEGPYGEASSARQYQNAVFVAGGNGIPGIYSECIDLAKKQGEKQNIKLIWVLREWKSLSWFFDELRALKGLNLHTEIHITKPECQSELMVFDDIISSMADRSVSASEEAVNEKKSLEDQEDTKSKEVEFDSSLTSSTEGETIDCIKKELSHITFKFGRPSMEMMVQQEIEEANGPICFVTCGHPIMVDDIRYSVVQNLDKSKYRVEYFEQLQVWA